MTSQKKYAHSKLYRGSAAWIRVPFRSIAERWAPSRCRAGVWRKRGHKVHLPLISQVAHSKYGIKRGKVRLAEERGVSEKDRRVGQEGRSILFERRHSECTSKASEYGVCVHSLPKFTKRTLSRWKTDPGFLLWLSEAQMNTFLFNLTFHFFCLWVYITG